MQKFRRFKSISELLFIIIFRIPEIRFLVNLFDFNYFIYDNSRFLLIFLKFNGDIWFKIINFFELKEISKEIKFFFFKLIFIRIKDVIRGGIQLR